MSDKFDDSEYFDKVFGVPENNITSSDLKVIKTAFKLAHDVRKFEIELFWKRGTYFWAFILASFTAYFYVFNKIIGERDLSLSVVMSFPSFAKIVLLIISCICFIFCFSWVLINKGSKFWQKNWESHIDAMENIFSGKLYKTILNTENNDFNSSVFSEKAFDYSVTKVTTLSSIIMMFLSGGFVIFHFVLFFWDSFKVFSRTLIIYIVIVCFIFLVISIFFLKKCKGNLSENTSQEKWRQR